ncbi:MAG: hypothetical protein DCC49_03310 [Acidobacteria bacterium]|nr:MAG: hypothetical protein DCC49_03310 [Acidobacteriota bacterium]
MDTKERIEQIFYAAIGAGDLWAERATELTDETARSKRVENLAKRGQKRINKIEKRIDKQRKDLDKRREQFETRLSETLNDQFTLPQLEEVLNQVQEAIKPIADRLGVEAPDLAARARARSEKKSTTKAKKSPAKKSPAKKSPAKKSPAKAAPEKVAVSSEESVDA